MPQKLRRRTKAREIALQALYQLELRGDEVWNSLRGFCKTAASGDRYIMDFCMGLVEACWRQRDKLDREIESVLEHWALARIAVVDRCVLRIGTYEILCEPAVPPKVAINEAIDLAKKYSTENSGVFVNGILDKILAEHPREQTDSSAHGAENGSDAERQAQP